MDRSELFDSPFMDAEVRAFIDAAPRQVTYSALAAQLHEKFGPDRAWPAIRIRAYCLITGAALRHQQFGFSRDAMVLSFIDDRIGRLPFGELAAACRAEFGPSRAPSRSALHRYSRYLMVALRDPAGARPT